MSFQAYIDNIHTKTGLWPADFKAAAEAAGIFAPDMKAMTMVNFLKQNYDLGHGHSMAIVQAFKNEGWIIDPKVKK
jgi:hypothetical protein